MINQTDKDDIQPGFKEKLPLKSVNGRRCLTKCYPKGTFFLHPILLTGVSDLNHNSCATDPIYGKELSYAQGAYYEKGFGLLFSDKCNLNDNKNFRPPNELESILLSFYFNPSDFLEAMYQLYSFDQVIYWTLENDFLPFDTIKRVHNCAWKAYGNKIDQLTNNVIDYYYDIAKNHWLHDYAKIIQTKYSFSFIPVMGEKVDLTTALSEIYDIVATKFFDYTFLATTIKKYVYEFKEQWDTIDSHYGNLKNYIFSQLVAHIGQQTAVSNVSNVSQKAD